jgi:hypothetical protein
MQRQRPRGVTILAILLILGGVASLFAVASRPLGIVSFALGIVYIIMGYGLFKGNRWAWTGTIVSLLVGIFVGIISTVFSIFNTSALSGVPSGLVLIVSIIGLAIGIGIDVIILYYLYRPHVKKYFGTSKNTLSC